MFLKNKTSAVSKIAGAGGAGRDFVPSMIAQDLHFLGNIVSDGMVDFDGKIEGNIRCHTLNVRKHGIVTGEVTAEDVFVYGKIKGIIRAKNVYLYSSCHIEGIIMHESIAIEDGAFLDGKCKRTDKPEGSSSDAFDGLEESAPIGGSEFKMLDNIRLIR